MRSLNIMGELFSGGKTVDIYDPVLTTGNTSSDPFDNACATRAAHGHSATAKATINNAVFFVKAVVKGELSIAFNAEDKILYGELNHFSKGTASIPAKTTLSRFAVTMDDPSKRRIVYEGDAPDEGNPYAILPYVAAEVLFSENDELYKNFVSAVASVHTGPRYTAKRCAFQFCDAFYMSAKYEFAKADIDVDENNLAIASIKEAYKMGYFQDLANVNNAAGLSDSAKYISENLEFPPCEAFSDIKKKTRRKKAAKKKETPNERC